MQAHNATSVETHTLLTALIAFTLVCFAWTWHTIARYGSRRDMLLITPMVFLLLLNIYYVYLMMKGEIGIAEHLVQMSAGSSIFPLFHLFFSSRLGLRNGKLNLTLWLIAIITFIPSIQISIHSNPISTPTASLSTVVYLHRSQETCHPPYLHDHHPMKTRCEHVILRGFTGKHRVNIVFRSNTLTSQDGDAWG